MLYVSNMVGYGRTDNPDGDVSLRSQGELLAALLNRWRLDAPDVVGHDGGMMCLRVHFLRGVRVNSIAPIDIVAP